MEGSQNRDWGPIAIALGSLGFVALFAALRAWPGVIMASLTFLALAPSALASLLNSERPRGWSYAMLPKALQIGLGSLIASGLLIWRIAVGSPIALPTLAITVVGGIAWLVWTVRREGWSGGKNASAG